MRLLKLPDPEILSHQKETPKFSDHNLYYKKIDGKCNYPEHFTGLGVVTLLKGSGTFKVNNDTVQLGEEGFLVVNRGSRMGFNLDGALNEIAILYFNTGLSKVIEKSYLLKKGISDLDNSYDYTLVEHVHFMNATLKQHFSLLLDLGNSCASFHALKADMVVRSILDELISENNQAIRFSEYLQVVKKTTRINLYKRIAMAKDWIEQHYGDQITVQQLADFTMLNAEHFTRHFKRVYDTTPHQFLIAVRIAEAERLLKSTNLSVSEICNRVGFDSLSSFSGLFAKKTGKSPRAYRSSTA